ncbi:hypothetical protein BC629DRAFT_321386 [Irpex lacteus]|nr:hypothetical protein BC629DRAFT_321386 [Irpex lacteus]
MLISAVMFLAPMLLVSPMLRIAGFGRKGLVGKSVATYARTALVASGPIAARSWFSTLQSAGMGGYGKAIVSTGVRKAGAALWRACSATRNAEPAPSSPPSCSCSCHGSLDASSSTSQPHQIPSSSTSTDCETTDDTPNPVPSPSPLESFADSYHELFLFFRFVRLSFLWLRSTVYNALTA